MANKYLNYADYINNLYFNPQKHRDQFIVRDVTFQITDDCPMSCTYCYQCNKGHKKMSLETAKKCVDRIFDMYYKDEGDFINKNTAAILFGFIGGEPLMAVDVMDYICSYFVERCIEEDHPWLYTWRAYMTSNGALYFNPEVQSFLKKFDGRISFSITLDGPKEIHDACRVYHDGHGNFDDAYAAKKHFDKHFYQDLGTKVTIAPENLKNLNKIIDFFINEGMTVIPANVVFEAEWTYDHAQTFYDELKKMADKLLGLDSDIEITLFEESFFRPLSPEENNNWCGGTGDMVAFDPDGVAYPCLRYMPSSLGDDIPPIIIGNADEGLFTRPEWQETKSCLDCITRRSQSTDECFNCPIAAGCAWCSAWNYQSMGSPNKRCTYICPMHKARALANVYYWNRYYALNGIDKIMQLHLPKEDALKIIDEAEYEMLIGLTKRGVK